jgi:twitching motility protein PilT
MIHIPYEESEPTGLNGHPAQPPDASESAEPIALHALFGLAAERGASDIHLTEHAPPVLRVDGELRRTSLPALSRAATKQLIYSLLTERQRAQFERDLELDFSADVKGLGRFRINVHMQRGSVEAAIRLVPRRVPVLCELGLPPIVAELARKPNGLVLVTGPTGVGKTTTLAAMVDLINHERRYLIVAIEDPIEYVHTNQRSIIKQREVHSDTRSFSAALVRALRQDPNVIVVGEMRDLETISTTLTAAETGHLVLATLHTPDCAQTIDRIIDIFPPQRQEEVKIQLAGCLQAIISQQLLPRADHLGRVLAYEILVATPAVRNLIRQHATEQLPTLLQTGGQHGMSTMDACLRSLYDRNLISESTATGRMRNSGEFHLLGTPRNS